MTTEAKLQPPLTMPWLIAMFFIAWLASTSTATVWSIYRMTDVDRHVNRPGIINTFIDMAVFTGVIQLGYYAIASAIDWAHSVEAKP